MADNQEDEGDLTVEEGNTMAFNIEVKESYKMSQEFSPDMTLTQMADFLSHKEGKLSK